MTNINTFCRSIHCVEGSMEKGSTLPVGITQLRGVIAILQWWSFNVLVIIMNKWIFQVRNCILDTYVFFWSKFHVLLRVSLLDRPFHELGIRLLTHQARKIRYPDQPDV